MLIEIFKRAPLWVFLLFGVLLVLGFNQSRDRRLGRARLLALPAAMAGLSLYGVYSAFGWAPWGISCWGLGLIAALLAGIRLAPAGLARWSAETRQFEIKGSWLPLILMMAIFSTKFAVGVLSARKLAVATDPHFASAISLIYGFFSGIFLARTALILRAERR